MTIRPCSLIRALPCMTHYHLSVIMLPIWHMKSRQIRGAPTNAEDHPRHGYCRPRSPDRIRGRCGLTRALRPLVQIGARRLAFSRAVSRRRRGDHQCTRGPPGSTSSPTATAALTSRSAAKSWFFYPIERLGGIHGHRSTSQGWMARHDIRPGKILWEVQEAYQTAIVKEKLTRGPLEYAALWQIAQRLTDRPVKFGAICAPALASMLWKRALCRQQGRWCSTSATS